MKKIYILLFVLVPTVVFSIDIRFNKIQSLEDQLKETIWAVAYDHSGKLLIGSESGLMVYDGYNVTSITNLHPNKKLISIRKLLTDKQGTTWIGTTKNGLFSLKSSLLDQYLPNNDVEAPTIITDIKEHITGLWLGSDEFLYHVDFQNNLTAYPLPTIPNTKGKLQITAINELSDNELLISTRFSVFSFNLTNNAFKEIEIEGLNNIYINNVYKDSDGNFWLASDAGVYKWKINSMGFEPFLKNKITNRINTVIVDNKNIWLGSNANGLLKIPKNTSSISYFQKDSINDSSISGNAIKTMTLGENGVMFVSSFYGGMSYFDTNSLKFGLESASLNHNNCTGSPILHGIDSNEQGILWISSVTGLFEFNTNTGICKKYNDDIHKKNVFDPFHPTSTFVDSNNTRWITTTNGFNKFIETTGIIDNTDRKKLSLIIYFMLESSIGTYMMGTSGGLHILKEGVLKKVNSQNNTLLTSKFFDFTQISNDKYIFATNNGLAVLDENIDLKLFSEINSQITNLNIKTVYSNGVDTLWFGAEANGLYQFSLTGKLQQRYDEIDGIPSNVTIKSILSHGKYLWMGSDNGLIRLNTESQKAHNFHKNDGLQDDFFIIGSASKSPTGMLYFGGRNGLNGFDPEEINLNIASPNIVLTNLTRFGKNIQAGVPNDDFVIDKHINELDELVLSHKDYVIGFEFAALDFADPSRNKYAFKLVGQDPEWNYVNADDRKISYSNLAPGDYVFRVKGANKDGTWNEAGKSLKVKVLPAPWLTWWAYTLYLLTFVALLIAYMYRKNKSNAEITKRLRTEVDKQTKELQIQKSTVENLLERKNELFANVSHEFRTPLTLILGPINKLVESSSQSREDIQSLEMVNRNANRLLTMIEQFLQLAKMSNTEAVNLVPQQVHANLETLVDSFKPLAENKRIALDLIQNDDASISATQDVIDIVFGNLISNAIKYTQIGGKITVKSQKQGDYVNIQVTDNGCGLDEKQQVEIFNRFTRLDSHLDITGVGIGLSVVEEMLKINNGTINVISQPGKGSTFDVRFHCVELTTESKHVKSNKTLIDQLLKESILEENSNHIQYYGSKSNESILIIDDNLDMRTHVAETLKHQYYCITADRGKPGISEAIKLVPDIIICDVMMPEMDGFQVSRVLRSDTRTSHIPLILLTALNDKKSRIKGWRENIDVYFTKPFDAQELLIQLENILVIRHILKKKAGAALRSGNITMNSGLPKNDQKFIDKFIKLISKTYSDPHFLRPQMAKMMAVSERQLQRKLKALIDKNPLDFLREYRIKQAAEILKEGNQVSITADKCGFNSVTYFSKCFKDQYGVSPKVYQQTCNNSENST